MASQILLTGGTGTLGRQVLPLLIEAGTTVRVLSRTKRLDDGGADYTTGDVSTGEGLDAATTGIHTIVHLAGTAKGDEVKARHVVQAAKRAGVHHIVYISVVGADQIPVESGVDRAMFGYVAAKRGAEEIIAESGIAWTTLRATQFHDFILMLAKPLSKLPVVPTFAGVRFQPVDSRDVAQRLVELALGDPAGLVPDFGGPRIYVMDELVRSYLRAVDKRRPLLPIRQPGRAARAYREGANLTPDNAVGTRTWEEFLAERVGSLRPA